MIKVLVSPSIPKWSPKIPGMVLSPQFKWCSNDFRQETNEWLMQRFGRKEVWFIIIDPITQEECIVCNPAVEQKLRDVTTAEENTLYGEK